MSKRVAVVGTGQTFHKSRRPDEHRALKDTGSDQDLTPCQFIETQGAD